MALKDTVISFILIGLFAVCFIGFGIQLQQDNNTDVRITNDTQIVSTYNELNGNLSGLRGDINDISNTTEQEEPSIGQSLILSSMKSSAVTLWRVPKVIYQVIALPLTTNLGIPAIVVNTIAAILGIILLFGLYRLIRVGE